MIRIIVVEDDEMFRELHAAILRAKGHKVVAVPDSTTLYHELLDDGADIVLLDVNLPGADGFAIAQQLRSLSRTRSLGIIMVTGQKEVQDRIAGIESGADIYLTKPVDPAELNAYVIRLYRRMQPHQGDEEENRWIWNRQEWTLTTPSGAAIPLTHHEFMLMDILAENCGRPVRRRDIIVNAFQEDYLQYDKRRLEAIVSRLKKKIKQSYALSQPIKVAYTMGYTFSAAISIV